MTTIHNLGQPISDEYLLFYQNLQYIISGYLSNSDLTFCKLSMGSQEWCLWYISKRMPVRAHTGKNNQIQMFHNNKSFPTRYLSFVRYLEIMMDKHLNSRLSEFEESLIKNFDRCMVKWLKAAGTWMNVYIAVIWFLYWIFLTPLDI